MSFMDKLELQAYGRVAQALARHAYAMAESEDKDYRHAFPHARGPIYYHWSTSTFEAVAHDLWRLGIVSPLDQRGDWAFHFAFNCTIDEANLVAEQNAAAGPTLAQLLITFVNLFADFGTEYWGFSTKPDIVFGKNARLTPTFDALASIGYLTKSDQGYLWTYLIGPIMRASYFDEEWTAH